MCGINGFNWPDRNALLAMNLATAHRGPDSDGVFVDDRVSLGNRRLAIIDLSENGNQPMCNEGGDIWITYNGEVYNFQSLRAGLLHRGHRFRSLSDVETLIHEYEEDGADCVQRFSGMFAFCIYDSKKRLLLLARDRLGIKPLYYYCRGGKLIFSSEIRGILQHDVPREVDDDMVYDYLYYGRVDHCEKTFFRRILRLPPASTIIYDLETKRLELKRYWDSPHKTRDTKSFEEAKGQLLELLREAINSHMVSDVPVGSCLSGGLDSSTVVALIEREAQDRFESFSAIYPGLPIDESGYISDLAKRLGIETNTVVPRSYELQQQIGEFVRAQEEPVGSASPFAQFKVMELARSRGAKVLLDGQGGDELLAGYPHYLPSLYLEALSCAQLARLFRLMARHGLAPLMVGLTPSFIKRWALGQDLFGTATHYQLALGLRPEFVRRHSKDSRVVLRIPRRLSEAEQLDLKAGLQALLRYEDKNSMHFSVEARVPFLDHRLVEFAISLPSEYKYKNGVSKFILRAAMKGLLPPSILERGKLGFPVPEDDWIREEPMASFVKQVISSDTFKERPYFDQGKCLRLLEKHQRGETKIGRVVWRWLNMELWLRCYVDAEPPTEGGDRPSARE